MTKDRWNKKWKSIIHVPFKKVGTIKVRFGKARPMNVRKVDN